MKFEILRNRFSQIGMDKLVIGILLIYFILTSLLVLNRWWQYENYYFDHGIFDQSLWNVSKGRLPLFDHIDILGLNQFGDHFNPSFYLLAPIYWITDKYEPLLVVGVLSVVGSAWVMYQLSRKQVKSRLMNISLMFAYLTFIGLQNGLIAGFHPELLALLTMALSFYFYEINKKRLFWVFAILTLGMKEIFVGYLFSFGLYVFLKKKNKRDFLLMIGISLIYAVVVMKIVIPYFRGGGYSHILDLSWKAFISGWNDSNLKVKTLWVSFVSFGFLPLMQISTLPLVAQDLLIRFATGKSAAWDLGLHYSLMLSVLLYFSSIISVSSLERREKYARIENYHAVIIILITIFLHIKLNGPFGLIYNKDFYKQTSNMEYLDGFLESIPKNGKVMTQNNFSVRLTHSCDIMLLRNNYWKFMPDTIAIDIRGGQNPNNYWPGNSVLINEILINDPNYMSMPYSFEQIVYVKKEGNVDIKYYSQFEKEEN